MIGRAPKVAIWQECPGRQVVPFRLPIPCRFPTRSSQMACRRLHRWRGVVLNHPLSRVCKTSPCIMKHGSCSGSWRSLKVIRFSFKSKVLAQLHHASVELKDLGPGFRRGAAVQLGYFMELQVQRCKSSIHGGSAFPRIPTKKEPRKV